MNTTEEKKYYTIRQNIVNNLDERNLTGIVPSEEIADRLLDGFRKNAPTELRRMIQRMPV